MESSFLSSSNAPNISRIAARLKEFLFSGRLIVILATALRFSTRMYFLSAFIRKPFLLGSNVFSRITLRFCLCQPQDLEILKSPLFSSATQLCCTSLGPFDELRANRQILEFEIK